MWTRDSLSIDRTGVLPRRFTRRGLVILGAILVVAAWSFRMDSRLVATSLAVLIGGGGAWLFFKSADVLVSLLPAGVDERTRPFVYIAPAVALVSLYLVYPAIHTIALSFQDAAGRAWVGVDNYVQIFTSHQTAIAVRNSVLWAVMAPGMMVGLGLALATILDRVSPRLERLAKSLVFVPLAISFVGASVIWTFVYSFRPEGFGDQIGLLNAVVVSLGGEPQQWLALQPWNNLFLMVILVWLEVGFATVVLSAAVKSVPEELLDAARIDGAGEWQLFRHITVPTIRTTIIVVWTTSLIYTWNTFDIVFVMTGGLYETSVIAERMVTEFFTFTNNGIGAALAVLLLIVVVPVMVFNMRSFRAQEQHR